MNQNRVILHIAYMGAPTLDGCIQDAVAGVLTSEEQIENGELWAVASRALTTAEFSAIVGYFWDGESQDEIAQQMGVSRPTVTRLISAALSKLKPKLEEFRYERGRRSNWGNHRAFGPREISEIRRGVGAN